MGLLILDFPREVLDIQASGAKGYRRLISNTSELERYWGGKNGLANVYMTVYGYRSTRPPKHHRCDYNTPVIRHFVMDFDCKDFRARREVDMDIPLQQVRTLHQYLLDNNIKHGVWFSGGGFHVWVTLDKTHMPTSGREVSLVKEAGRRLLTGWESELSLTCSDPAVPFDTAGMIRIPNSYNDKKGLWCIPLKSDELMGFEAEDIMQLALHPRKGYFNYGEKGAVLDVKKKTPTPFKMDSPKMNIATAKMDGVKILPCLNAIACQEGNPDHYPRVYLAQFLLHRLRMFFPRSAQTESEREKAVDEVVGYMSTLGWADWDENITRKYIRHIAETYDDHPTCATLFGKGYCLGKCQFHDGTGLIHAQVMDGDSVDSGSSDSPSSDRGTVSLSTTVVTSSYSLPMVEGGQTQ